MTDKKEQGKGLVIFQNPDDFKMTLAGKYQKTINNFFGDEKKALKFLSGAVAAIQSNPVLLECTPTSLMNSFVTMASLELMPSNVSGEAYVLPYNIKGTKIAQFQLGYQGLVTLFYRAGARAIIAEIVREKDKFSFKNGVIEHDVDPFSERGIAKGAYVIVELQAGGKIYKVMSKKEILHMAEKFSKSFKTDFSPWKECNDPELWMWKKTVLKQAAKLVPKNETIYKAIAADNDDSILADRKRVEEAENDTKSLQMGNFIQNAKDTKNQKPEGQKAEAVVIDEATEGLEDLSGQE